MHDDHVLVEDRTRRVLLDRVVPAVHTVVAQLDVAAWHVGGGTGEPVPAAVALPGLDPAGAAEAGVSYEPFPIGAPWGRAWSTTWFHLTGTVPADLTTTGGDTVELLVDLGWNGTQAGSQAEGLVFRPDGSTVKALNPFNAWVPVEAAAGGTVDLYVEAAANPNFFGGPRHFQRTVQGDRSTVTEELIGRLARADVVVRHAEVAELAADLEFLVDLQAALDLGTPRRWRILRALTGALDALDLGDIVGTTAAARAVLAPVLAVPAVPTAHTVTAIGHAHIDSAWLWPVRETVRKVARTTSNVLDLLDREPTLHHAMSSAQQYAWMQETRPELWQRIVDAVAGGRLHPVGGMWVESDTNMVGAEAMVRQFSFGQRFFRDAFGVTAREAWLPDTFGYSAALPQIVRLAGIRWFLTQKISWSTTNRFPHHSFRWEGIDGTRVFTHFPPSDTYNGQLTAGQLVRSVEAFRDKAGSDHSLIPFGWGDGGGGPTREMLQRATRSRDTEGAPKVVVRSPAAFFAEAEAQYADAPVWKGELYLELHRGTLTSQADVKRGNRDSERLFHEAETWATAAAVRGLAAYPHDELEHHWKSLLLHQFHDMLPGTGIAWVHQETRERHREIATALEGVIDRSLRALAGDGTARLVANASPYPRDGVTASGIGVASGAGAASGTGTVASGRPGGAVQVVEGGDGSWTLTTDGVRVVLGPDGTITSAVGRDGREAVPTGSRGALLQLHADLPVEWDAWDVDEYYRNTVVDVDGVDRIEAVTLDDGRAAVRVHRSFGRGSHVVQDVTIGFGGSGGSDGSDGSDGSGGSGRADGGDRAVDRVDVVTVVDWQEQEHILKLAFPVDVHADTATYETQFGHLVRPTHVNTTWEAARFEVAAHRWVHVGERDWGAAVVNDATYGHDVTRHEHPAGGTFSTIRLSLLRGPVFPDPETDLGRHVFRSSLVLGAGVAEAVREGYAMWTPPRETTGDGPVEPLVTVDGPVVLETTKTADDRSGDLVLRLYEPHGVRATATVRVAVPVEDVREVDLLEDDRDGSGDVPVGTALVGAGADGIRLRLRPFEIVTLRMVTR